MSLRYALLAILRVGPLSGYDLQKQFHQSVGHVWHAPDSQIYPELRKMEQLGLVEGEEQPRGERGTRRLYHVTDAGDRAFVEWMASPLDYQRVRDPSHLRAAYLETTTPEAADLITQAALSLRAGAQAARRRAGDDPFDLWYAYAGQLDLTAAGLDPVTSPYPEDDQGDGDVIGHIDAALAAIDAVRPLEGPPDLLAWAWHVSEIRRLAQQIDAP